MRSSFRLAVMDKEARADKVKNNTNCCVHGCHSRKSKNPSVHFHYFPHKNAHKVKVTNKSGSVESVDRRKVWENTLSLDKPASRHLRVCSRHFLLEDYRFKNGNAASSFSSNKCPRLKETAVPSQNLPTIESSRRIDELEFETKVLFDNRKERLHRRHRAQRAEPNENDLIKCYVESVRNENAHLVGEKCAL